MTVNKITNPPTQKEVIDKLNEVIDNLGGFVGGYRNIFEDVVSDFPLTNAGLHLKDGTLLQHGSYGKFVDYVGNLYNSGLYRLYCYVYADDQNFPSFTYYRIYTRTTTIDSNTVLYNEDGSEYTGYDFQVVEVSGSYEIQYNGNSCYYDGIRIMQSYKEFTTEALWQQEVTNTGYCDKYVYDEDILYCYYDSDNDDKYYARTEHLENADGYVVYTISNGVATLTNFVIASDSGVIPITLFDGDNAISVTRDSRYDINSSTVRLPKWGNQIVTTLPNTLDVKGTGKGLGLTDGTNFYTFNAYNTYGTNATLNSSVFDVGTVMTGSQGVANTALGVSTDGTKSGIVAETSSIKRFDVYHYVVIATSIKTDIEVDIDEIATDLNGKADVDLTNCTNGAFESVVAHAQSTGKNTVMSWNAPDWANKVSKTTSTTYTAEKNGWIVGYWISASNVTLECTINDVVQYSMYIHGGAGGYRGAEFFLPVAKGDTYSSTGGTLYFVPTKGGN